MLKLLFNEKILEWINKNKITFIIIFLVVANIYQYLDGLADRKEYREDIRVLNLKISTINENSLAYERTRSNSLEKLLYDMLRMYSKVDERKDTIIDNSIKNSKWDE